MARTYQAERGGTRLALAVSGGSCALHVDGPSGSSSAGPFPLSDLSPERLPRTLPRIAGGMRRPTIRQLRMLTFFLARSYSNEYQRDGGEEGEEAGRKAPA